MFEIYNLWYMRKCFFLCSLFLLIFWPQKIKAQEVLFADDFSTGFTKWQSVHDNANLWTIIEGVAQVFIPSYSTVTRLVPKDEYWSQDWQHISYELEISPIRAFDKNISFAFEDSSNWYDIHFMDTWYQLARVQNGKVVFTHNASYSMSNGQKYVVKIDRWGELIRIYVNGVKITDVVDPSFNANFGKIVLIATTGAATPTEIGFDNIIVRRLPELQEIKLPVTALKQNDPTWQNEEYDAANTWSTAPSIGRWGCALTSMAMILNYHGIDITPDQSPLDPSSLNRWLKAQPDGYLGEGLLNWVAIGRLTRLVAEIKNTPKLEYIYRGGNSLEPAAAAIKTSQPSILQVAGHFLVASGLTGTEKDLYINDPFYSYPKFSEAHTPLLSTRLFTPSHTDLSYLLLVATPETQITLTTADGSPIPNLQVFTEEIKDPTPGATEKTKLAKIYQIAQPSTATYNLEIRQNSSYPYQLTLYNYDQEGELSLFKITGLAPYQSEKLQINFNKTGDSSITQEELTWESIKSNISLLKAKSLISSQFTFQKLMQIASWASTTSNSQDSRRYLGLFSGYLLALKPKMTDSAYSILEQKINLLANNLAMN